MWARCTDKGCMACGRVAWAEVACDVGEVHRQRMHGMCPGRMATAAGGGAAIHIDAHRQSVASESYDRQRGFPRCNGECCCACSALSAASMHRTCALCAHACTAAASALQPARVLCHRTFRLGRMD